MINHTKAITKPSHGPAPTCANKLRDGPPSTTHQADITPRKGDKAPFSDACAVTANTKPDSSARKLPLAESTNNRLAQPRVITMPAPKISPPIKAPDMLPRADNCRAVLTSKCPKMIISCTPTIAAPNDSSHTVNLSPNLPCQNSITAARRQKRER